MAQLVGSNLGGPGDKLQGLGGLGFRADGPGFRVVGGFKQ